MKTLFLLFTTAIGLLFLCFGCDVSRFKDFDVASNNFDPNVFPLNPKWGKQVEQGATPDPHVSCPIYSDNEDAHEWTSSPQYPNCTSYVVTFNGAVPCGAHVNFMPVTYEGKVFFVEHRPPVLDDEYTFNVARMTSLFTIASRARFTSNLIRTKRWTTGMIPTRGGITSIITEWTWTSPTPRQ